MAARIAFTDAQRDDIVRRYDAREPPRNIAGRYEISRGTLYELLHRWGVTLWKDRPPRERMPAETEAPAPLPEPAAAAAPGPNAIHENLSLRRRVEIAAEHDLAAVEGMLKTLRASPAGLADAERAARTLASLSRTLRELSALSAPETAANDDELPRDIDELRRVLAERLDRLAGEAGDGGARSGDDAA